MAMQRVLSAFLRALVSQMHPKMLGLLLLPFVMALVFWILVAWWIWDPLNDWLRDALFGAARSGLVAGWIDATGVSGWGAWLSALVAVLLLAPLMFVAALIVISVAAMPVVNRHLSQSAYRDVTRAGGWSVAQSLWVAVSGVVVFALGYVLTMPLWLVPLLGLLVPWLWWSWLTARIMRFDSLVEHADPSEREALIGRHRREYLALALLVTALNYVPPLFLITPVLSALAFGHFSLSALRQFRAQREGPQQRIADQESPQPRAIR
jgi:uncharacterized protein involved in cysteine biosynthesis